MHTTTKTNWLTATLKLQFLLEYLHLQGGKKLTCMLVVPRRIFNNLTLYGYESMHTCTKFNTTLLAHDTYLIAQQISVLQLLNNHSVDCSATFFSPLSYLQVTKTFALDEYSYRCYYYYYLRQFLAVAILTILLTNTLQ